MSSKKVNTNSKLKGQSRTESTSWYLNSGLHVFLLLVITYMAYSAVGRFDFTNWDEKRYIFETPLVQKLNWNNVKLMFTNKVLASYNPLVLLSLSIDYFFVGNKASWYHIHNLLIHLANGILLYWCLNLFTSNKLISFFVAGLFLLHPMHVEAVAWIASRKDVLYSFYFLISTGLYLVFLRTNYKLMYFLSLFAFLLSLLAKSQAVVLPVVFILILWYKKVISKTQILRLVPFLLLSVVFGLVTLYGGNKGLTADEFGANFGFIDKIFLSSHAFVLYLVKCLLPINQSAIYAFNPNSLTQISSWSYASIIVVPVFVWILYIAYKRYPELFFGLSFFTVCTFLILHVLATNSSLIYERFTYISYIGLFFAIGWLILKIVKKQNFFFLSLGLLVVLIPLTKSRAEVWRNSETLWTDVIEKQPSVSVAYNNRGNVYYLRADWNKALVDFEKAIELNPKYPNSYSNRGSVKIYLNQFKEALADNEKAISLSPNFPEAWLGKGVALYHLNKLEESLQAYNKAISLMPNFPNAYNNRGGTYFKLKEYDKAIADFNTALRFAPNYDEARVNKALALIEKQEYSQAETELLKVKTDTRRNNILSDLYLKNGLFLYQQGKSNEAIQYYNKALAINPQNAEAWYNMGGTYLMQKNIEKAKECWRNVLVINPNHPEAVKWLKQIGG